MRLHPSLVCGEGARDEDRAEARIEHAGGVADAAQRRLLRRADVAGLPVTAAEWTGADRRGARRGGGRYLGLSGPLLLVDSPYCPVGRVMPPADGGALLIWLRPSTEAVYLPSLAPVWRQQLDTGAGASVAAAVVDVVVLATGRGGPRLVGAA